MNTVKTFHSKYCILHDENSRAFLYDRGPVSKITFEPFCSDTNTLVIVNVFLRSGEHHAWNTKYVDAYTSQFGIAVSNDGKYVFLQTWENGLFCFDARTGNKIWRTKSKRGITDTFVLDDAILCQQHDRALQLLDVNTGAVITERRVSSWGFTAIDHKHIICRTRAKQWDLIEAASLKTIRSFSDKEFTDGHEDYCVNRIELGDNGTIWVFGFKSAWDGSGKPDESPNAEFTAVISCDELITSGCPVHD